LSNSSNKKIIPIIIAVIAIGAFAIIFNFTSIQDQANEKEQTGVSQKIEESIQEIKENSKPESTPASKLESNHDPSQLRAVIIDQLHDDIPNHGFQTNATRMLEDAGYHVDLYTTKDITVEFYKKLPSMNYNFILIRTHGGEDPSDENPTFMFTGEKYSKEKYTIEQISHQVGYGIPIYDEELKELEESGPMGFDNAYFTIGSKMVKEGMIGTFPNSIIIVGGCESARSHDLMESLMKKGAKHVLGWDATIGTRDNDKAMISLIEDIVVNKVTLNDAHAKINKELVPEFENFSLLKLFSAV
jgi:hypothetical protein